MGHSVVVISESPTGARTESRDGEVDVVRIPAIWDRVRLDTAVTEQLGYSVAVAAEIQAQSAARAFDVVEFPEWGAEGFFYLVNRTEWNYIPTVVQIHGPLVMLADTVAWPDKGSEHYRSGRFFEGTCLMLADRVYSCSKRSTEWCRKYYGLDASRVPTLHTGVDIARFRPDLAVKAAAPTIAFVGRVGPNKGVPVLVEACLQVARTVANLRLRLIGRGDDRFVGEMRRLCEAAGFPDLLELPGFVGRDELPAVLASAHVFVLPSAYEPGPGLVNLEAMACGLPVIACEGSGSAEVVAHGRNGLLVPPGDSGALAGALDELIGNASRRDALAAGARLYVVAEAAQDDCLKRLEALYLEASRTRQVAAS
jgi:glycosyltransferase involved in cell wall biosynthesis